MTKRERELFTALKRLRDAIWDADIPDEHVSAKLNKAYIAAGDLVAKVLAEKSRSESNKVKPELGADHRP